MRKLFTVLATSRALRRFGPYRQLRPSALVRPLSLRLPSLLWSPLLRLLRLRPALSLALLSERPIQTRSGAIGSRAGRSTTTRERPALRRSQIRRIVTEGLEFSRRRASSSGPPLVAYAASS